ncbi:putative kirola-like [Capsicum annuum]|nr:putative kirola-like [Capsicum annuum]
MKTSSNNLSDSPHSGFFPSLFTITMDSFQEALDLKNLDFPVVATTTTATECKGLSLSIITVAGVLKRKSKPSWEDALVQLQRSIPVNIPRVTKNVYQPLKLNYDQLESDDIRYLFLLCSLFEDNSNIQTEDRLRFGMELGIFLEIKNLEEAIKRVNHLLETLKDQFLTISGFRQKLSQNADMIRHMAISIAAEGKHALMVCHDVNLESSPLGFDTSQASGVHDAAMNDKENYHRLAGFSVFPSLWQLVNDKLFSRPAPSNFHKHTNNQRKHERNLGGNAFQYEGLRKYCIG